MYIRPSQSPNMYNPSFPLLVSKCLFSTSVSLFVFANKIIYTIFSRFHTYVLICSICFSLSDLLHSVWQSLGPSTSLHMTQLCSFFMAEWYSVVYRYCNFFIPFLACNVGDLGSIPWLGRSPGEGKGCLLQDSGLENFIECVIQGVTKSWTGLSNFHFIKFYLQV